MKQFGVGLHAEIGQTCKENEWEFEEFGCQTAIWQEWQNFSENNTNPPNHHEFETTMHQSTPNENGPCKINGNMIKKGRHREWDQNCWFQEAVRSALFWRQTDWTSKSSQAIHKTNHAIHISLATLMFAGSDVNKTVCGMKQRQSAIRRSASPAHRTKSILFPSLFAVRASHGHLEGVHLLEEHGFRITQWKCWLRLSQIHERNSWLKEQPLERSLIRFLRFYRPFPAAAEPPMSSLAWYQIIICKIYMLFYPFTSCASISASNCILLA